MHAGANAEDAHQLCSVDDAQKLCPAPLQQAAEDKYTIPAHWAANGLTRLTWDSEGGILPAFADLDAAGNVGFKKALLSCLASTSCVICQASVPNVGQRCNAI
jgi:hypothetical protein